MPKELVAPLKERSKGSRPFRRNPLPAAVATLIVAGAMILQ